jgi:hypothetical protein
MAPEAAIFADDARLSTRIRFISPPLAGRPVADCGNLGISGSIDLLSGAPGRNNECAKNDAQ